MTSYEKELLSLAVDAYGARGYRVAISAPGVAPAHPAEFVVTAYANDPNRPHVGHAPTFAEALAILLRDMGGEVPERPSAERIAEALMALAESVVDIASREVFPISDLRDLYAREPLTVLALLEGGGS